MQPDFQSFIVENESSFSFVFKGLLYTEKYQKARELIDKNFIFLNQKKIKEENSDLFYAFSDLNNGALNELENYENKEGKIRLDESLLHAYFSDATISIMPLKVKQFIVTSIMVLHYLSTNSNTLDYSSAVMPVMRCIETLLYKIIGENYLSFIQRELNAGNISFNELPQDLVYFSNASGKKFLKSPEWVTIGNALSWTSINTTNKNIPSDLFLDFCYEKMDNSYEHNAECFVNGLREIRPKRNKAAHTEIVTFEDAQECNEYLITVNKFIEFLLSKFSFCFNNKEEQ